MHHSKEWKGLERWSYFHHFFHFYNNSNALPGWLYTIRILISCFQTFPILFGLPIIGNPKNNQILSAVKYLSDLFVYFSFSPEMVTIGFLLIFDALSIFLTIISYASDKLIFNWLFSLILHFFYEILSPIMFNLAAATLQKEITNIVFDQKNDFYFISALISTIIFFLNFLFITYSHSESVYFNDFYFESWSSWNIFFRTTLPSVILLILPLYNKHEKVGFYVINALIMVYSFLFIYWDSRIPFLTMIVNFSFLIFDFYLLFIGIFHIFPYIFTDLDPSINIPIIVALLIFSIPCAEAVSHYRCHQFNSILLNSRYQYERPYDIDSDSNEGGLKISHQRSLEDIDEKENNNNNDDDYNAELPYPISLANKNVSILLLRHLINNKSQSIELARFLFERSTNFDIWFTSVRFLILMKVITYEDATSILHIDPDKVSLFATQAFCDAQYEAVGLKVTRNSARKFLDEIDGIQSSIVKILKFVCISIKPQEDEQAAHEFIVEYSRACNDYELYSYIFLNHAKHCPSMLRRLSNYYYKLRGDLIQGQLWEQKLGSYHISLFEKFGSRSLTSLNSFAKPAVTSNRIKSQTLVQRIQSKAVLISSILFWILFLIVIVLAFNRFENNEHNFVISPLVSISMVHISCYSIITQSAQMNLSMQIFTSCYPQYLNHMTRLNQTLLWPPESTVNLLSTLMQNLSRCISNLDVKIDGASQSIDIWADPYYEVDGNNSLQFEVVTLNLISSLLIPGLCNSDSYNLLNKYISIESTLVQPFRNLHAYLLIYCNSVYNKFVVDYEIYIAVFIFLIICFTISIIVVSIKYERSERNKFWKVYQTVDPDDLKVFKKSLSHVNSRSNLLLKHQSSNMTTTLDNTNLSSFVNSRSNINLSNNNYQQVSKSKNNNNIDSSDDTSDDDDDENHDKVTPTQSNRSHSHTPKISFSRFNNSTITSFSNVENDNDNDYEYDNDNNNYTTSNGNENNNDADDDGGNDNDDDNDNDTNLINTEDILKYKINRFHPQNSFAFIIYSILFIFCIALVGFLMIMPYKKIRDDFYDFYYDLQNMGYIAEKMLNVASLSPLLYNENDSSDYFPSWNSSCFRNNDTDFRSFRKADEEPLNELIKYNNQMKNYCQKFIDSSFNDSTIIFDIIRLAYYDVNQIAYKLTLDAYARIHYYDDKFIMYAHLSATCYCIILIMYTAVFILRSYAYSIEFNSMKSILMLLPSPYSSTIANLIANFDMSSGAKKQDVDISKFQSRYIIKQSTDAIIVVDSSKKIQDVNKSAIEMLGYNRDQLIGELIEDFISKNDQQTSDFISQLNFINRQANVAPHYNLHMICAHKKLTPVSCTLLFIASEDSFEDNEGNKPAFALVLRDRTVFNEQEKQLQEAKKKVEVLLYRILPRVMANKLLSKDEHLYSQVDRATIIFIAIVNFLDWCRLHTHTEIMELLNGIVTKFDKQISKFPTLVKLKIINGVYMAAGGLFNEVSKNSHPVEAIEFAIRCGRAIRKRNLQTKSNLQLQIGINTGGPIIAGILGSDKPLFDIWGDAVNVSARLETSAPFDTAQILQETKDSLPPDVYKFTVREKVFLKGKGDATTYVLDLANPYIHQPKNNSINSFSYDSFTSTDNLNDKKNHRRSSSKKNHRNNQRRNDSSSYLDVDSSNNHRNSHKSITSSNEKLNL